MILGVSYPAEGFGHDASVALIEEDGRVLWAQAEERFSRIKMDGSFPCRAFAALKRATGLTAGDLSAVAVPFWSTAAKVQEALRLAVCVVTDPAVLAGQVRNRLAGDRFQRGMAALGAYDYHGAYRTQLRIAHAEDGRPTLADGRAFLQWAGLQGVPVVGVDHHLAHAAGAYWTSGWSEALVVTADGVGALKSGLVAEGRAGRLRVVARTFYPHSAGGFWEAITAICGFHHMKHGGKVTGLAAYGNPGAACYEVMRRALEVRGLRIRSAVDPLVLARVLKDVPREDVAATAQRRLEEVVVELVRRAVAWTGLRRVALAGGVFGNVKLNQRIAEIEGVEEVYVFPAMGDEGLALGAALWAAASRRPVAPRRLAHLYLGIEASGAAARDALARAGLTALALPDDEIAARVVDALVAGQVVGIYRGRMEFGPRALGHRTILAETRDRAVNDWLNRRLRRSEFMPFAPVTLDDHADRCYENLARCRYTAEFMTITCPCTPWMRRVSPAVVHVDGTARPQLLRREVDPFYYEILHRYFERTGIPSLINTSFNLHEEPIVCTPDDAVRAFVEGGLDAMVVGPFYVTAPGGSFGANRRAAAEATR